MAVSYCVNAYHRICVCNEVFGKLKRGVRLATAVQIYRNKRNSHKYIEVHNDGHYHNSVRQYLYWDRNVVTDEPLLPPVKNMVGDGKLHRWRKKNLKELLEDYEPMEEE